MLDPAHPPRVGSVAGCKKGKPNDRPRLMVIRGYVSTLGWCNPGV